MKILGLDFTSAPNRRKPITCAVGHISGGQLHISDFQRLTQFEQFEDLLLQPGPWYAGIDFPFGQPAKLIQNLNWGVTWESYVQIITGMTIKDFEDTLKRYRDGRPSGDKQHLRSVDQRADSRSPMMLYGVPVGRMFFQGAPRLLKSNANIIPCRPNGDNRVVFEAYPALVARRWAGSYKADEKKKQTPQRKAARQAIVNGIQRDCAVCYGFDLDLNEAMAAEFVEDPSGDSLDAVLCAIQTAWAYQNYESGYGIPADCDPLEGWIVDPILLV